MEFKSAGDVFSKRNRFADEMKRFACDEAARFTTSGNEAASASIDEFAEKGVRFSIEKNKRKIHEQKQILKEIKQKEKELKHSKEKSIHQSEAELPDGFSTSGLPESSSDSRSGSEAKEKSDSSNEASKKEKAQDTRKENAKKEKAKEQKKAGAKTAVASMLTMQVHIRSGKNHCDHWTILSQRTLDLLTEYWKSFPRKREFLFVGLKYPYAPLKPSGVEIMIRKVGNAAGIEHMHPHILRHSFASHMIEQGVSLENIQAMMGHRNPDSTHQYIHVSNKSLMGIKSPLDHPVAKKRGRKKKNV